MEGDVGLHDWEVEVEQQVWEGLSDEELQQPDDVAVVVDEGGTWMDVEDEEEELVLILEKITGMSMGLFEDSSNAFTMSSE